MICTVCGSNNNVRTVYNLSTNKAEELCADCRKIFRKEYTDYREGLEDWYNDVLYPDPQEEAQQFFGVRDLYTNYPLD